MKKSKHFIFILLGLLLALISCDNEHVHSFNLASEVEPTCETDGYKLFICDCKEEKKEVIEKLGHDYGTLIEAVDPTCESNGSIAHYDCSRCDKVFDSNKNEITSTEVNALEHSYIFKEFVWSDFECSAVLVCSQDASHEKLETLDVVKNVINEPTETEEGINEYSVSFYNF